MEDIIAREEKLSQKGNEPLVRDGFHFFKMRTISAFQMASHLHMHDAIELIFVKEGSLRVSYDDKTFYAYPGDMFLFRSRGIHSMYTEECEVNEYYVLKLSTAFLANVLTPALSQKLLLRFLCLNSDFKYLWTKEELEGTKIKKALTDLVDTYNNPSDLVELGILGYIFCIFHEIYNSNAFDFEKNGAVSNQIYKAVIYVNDNCELELRAEDVAKRFGMSLGYFSRCFKDAVGMNFRDYVIQIRMNKAEQLIQQSDMPIIDVAILCGYPNVSHFIASYKKHKGITPLKARQSKT